MGSRCTRVRAAGESSVSARSTPVQPSRHGVRSQAASYVTDLGSRTHFSQQLWLEAQRRGLAQAQRVVFIGDGAQWLWETAHDLFPEALQILDLGAFSISRVFRRFLCMRDADMPRPTARTERNRPGAVPAATPCIVAVCRNEPLAWFPGVAARLRRPRRAASSKPLRPPKLPPGVVTARLQIERPLHRLFVGASLV